MKQNIAFINKQHELEKDKNKECTLLQAYKAIPFVYVAKVGDLEGEKFTVKIGETDNIAVRVIELRCNYEHFTLTDVFPCVQPHAYEQYLLKRPDIKQNRIIGTELIRINDTLPYDTLVKIIKKNISIFNKRNTDKEEINTQSMRIKEKLLEL
jgi:hypothetical protein